MNTPTPETDAAAERDQLRRELNIERARAVHYREAWQKATHEKLQLRKICDELTSIYNNLPPEK